MWAREMSMRKRDDLEDKERWFRKQREVIYFCKERWFSLDFIWCALFVRWVMSHMWMSHVTHVNESCHTCEWVMSHIWMSHVTRMNESCHTCEWVMSHMWMSYNTYTAAQHCTDHRSSASPTCVTWLIHMCDMTHSYVWHDSFIRVIWLVHMWRDSIHTCRDSFICARGTPVVGVIHMSTLHRLKFFFFWVSSVRVTCLIPMWCDSIHVWRDSFIGARSLGFRVHTIHVWRDSFMGARHCDVTHSNRLCVWHVSFI